MAEILHPDVHNAVDLYGAEAGKEEKNDYRNRIAAIYP